MLIVSSKSFDILFHLTLDDLKTNASLLSKTYIYLHVNILVLLANLYL